MTEAEKLEAIREYVDEKILYAVPTPGNPELNELVQIVNKGVARIVLDIRAILEGGA